MKQMWKCIGCGHERVWGSIPMAQARAETREVGEVLNMRPMLRCEGSCDALNTTHVYSRDIGSFDLLGVATGGLAHA